MHGSETLKKNDFTEKEKELISKGFTQDEIYQIRVDEEEMKKEAAEWEEKNNGEDWKEDPFWNQRVVENVLENAEKEDREKEQEEIFIGRKPSIFDKLKGMFKPKDRPYDILGPGTKVNIVHGEEPEPGTIENIEGSEMFIRYENGALGVIKPEHIKDVNKTGGNYFIFLKRDRRFKIGG